MNSIVIYADHFLIEVSLICFLDLQHKPSVCTKKATAGDKLTIHYTVLWRQYSAFPPNPCHVSPFITLCSLAVHINSDNAPAGYTGRWHEVRFLSGPWTAL